MAGTVESTGVNGSAGTTSAPLADLGYTWIGNNAKGDPPSGGGTLGAGGPNKSGVPVEGLLNASDRTNDTHRMAADSDGTVESGGING